MMYIPVADVFSRVNLRHCIRLMGLRFGTYCGLVSNRKLHSIDKISTDVFRF